MNEAEYSQAPLSDADLYVELAKLTLLIMRRPEGGDGAARRDGARRLVAQFESRASEVLDRASPSSREYAARRIAELVQSSPAFRLLGDDAVRRNGCAVAAVEAAESAHDRLTELSLAPSGSATQ